MKKLLEIVALVLLLSHPTQAKEGHGDLRFTSRAFNNFLAYLRGDGSDIGGVMMSSGMPIGFAINQKGNNTFYMYCPKKYGDNCMPGGHMTAQSRCTTNSKKKSDGRCFVFAKKRHIVWDGIYLKIKKNPSKDEIRKIFAKYGWYGPIENKERQKKETKKVTKNSLDFVNKLKKLKELKDSGILTNEEFIKAKKKLLE
jgi:hypothetical protein